MNTARYRPYIVFALLALTILLPLLSPGFVLTLDMVFTPTIRMPEISTSSFLFYTALHVLNVVIASDVLEKMMLFVILFLSGFGMYRLVKSTYNNQDRIGAYVAGALYMINPYTYDRFMAGQFAVLFGYSLLPFLCICLVRLVEHPALRIGILTGALLTLIGIVSIHTLGLAAIVISVGLILASWRYRHAISHIINIAKTLAASFSIFFIASCYWIVPLLLGKSTAAKAIAGFSVADNTAFATLGNGLIGKLVHVIRLQGFWAEATGEFTLPQTHLPGWGIVVVMLWILVAIGATARWRSDKRFMVAMLLVSASLGALLAAGILGSAAGNIALLRGFREPDKFAGLVALTYAFCAGSGVHSICNFFEQRKQHVLQQGVLAAILLLPILLTPTMFWGFGGQLHPRQYPPSWQAVNQQLDADSSSFRVLFLPWHLYMYFRFADRIIMNPAPSYFDKPILSSNDPEFGGASPDKPNATKTLLTKQILPVAPNKTTLGSTLAPLGIKYILLDKDDDYTAYVYLDQQHDLRLIHDDTTFRLYRNLAFRDQP